MKRHLLGILDLVGLASFLVVSGYLTSCQTIDKARESLPELIGYEQAQAPAHTSDSFLSELQGVAEERSGSQAPAKSKVRFEFEGGDWIEFQIHSDQEGIYIYGSSSKGNLRDPNRLFRYGILEELGDTPARRLGQNQLQLGHPLMPVLPYSDVYYWKSRDNKVNYELNEVSIFAIRSIDLQKGKLGITGDMISVSGSILKHRGE